MPGRCNGRSHPSCDTRHAAGGLNTARLTDLQLLHDGLREAHSRALEDDLHIARVHAADVGELGLHRVLPRAAPLDAGKPPVGHRDDRLDEVLAAELIAVLRHAGGSAAGGEAGEPGHVGRDALEIADLPEHIVPGRRHADLFGLFVFDLVDAERDDHAVHHPRLAGGADGGVGDAELVAEVVEVALGHVEIDDVGDVPPVLVGAHVPDGVEAIGVFGLELAQRGVHALAVLVEAADLVDGDPAAGAVLLEPLLDRVVLVADAALPGAGIGAAAQPRSALVVIFDRGGDVAPAEAQRAAEPGEVEVADDDGDAEGLA